MKTSDLLWARLELAPQCTTLKMALIDQLLEEGEVVEAETIRWCVVHKKWDIVNTAQDHFWTEGTDDVDYWPWYLPPSIFMYLNNDTKATSRECIRQLSSALVKLKIINPFPTYCT